MKKINGNNLPMVTTLLMILEILTPMMFMIPSTTIITVAITFLPISVPAGSHTAPRAVANPTAIADHAIVAMAHFIKPTSKPTKLPNASFAYTYGPPFLLNIPPISAKHKAMDITSRASNTITHKLLTPTKAAALPGSKKIPVPIIALTPKRMILIRPNLLVDIVLLLILLCLLN